MTIKIINKDFDKKRYNSVAIHPLQSWEWGEAREKMGIEVLRVGWFDNEKLTNVFELSFHKIPHTSFTIGYLPRSVITSSEVLDFLQEEGKKINCIFIKIEPYEKKSNVKSQMSKVLTKSSHPLFPQWTQMIDLTKSEEELLKNMHPKTRYNIGIAQKRGVTVKEMTNNEGFSIFSKLYFETCRRQQYRGHNEKYHEIVFDTLKDTISHIFIAFYTYGGRTTPLASYHVFTFNDVMYYVYGGSSLEHKNVMAPNLLMWEVMQFGKKNGFSTFDMWGSLGPDYRGASSVGTSILRLRSGLRTNPNSDWIGFTRFKQGYGGEFVEFVGSFDLVLNPILYKWYGVINKIRRKML